jgi:hypothetical protein
MIAGSKNVPVYAQMYVTLNRRLMDVSTVSRYSITQRILIIRFIFTVKMRHVRRQLYNKIFFVRNL